MKTNCLFLFVLFSAASLFGNTAEKELIRLMERVHTTTARVRAGNAPEAPVLDGVMSAGEWDNATVLSGFSTTGNKGQLLGAKPGKVFIQRTNDHLYIAVKTITRNDSPGGGLSNNATKKDSISIANDDSVELTFQNPQKPDELKHLLFNPGGYCLDILRTISTRNQDPAWDMKGLKIASKVETFYWVLEIAVPLKEIVGTGGKFRFNVARNWCDTGSFSTLNKVAKYFQPKEMIEVTLDQKNVIVRQDEIGNFDDGNFDAAVTLDNHYGKDVIFALMLHEYTFKKIDGKVKRFHKVHGLKHAIVKPGEHKKLVFSHNDDSKKMLWFSTAVLDVKTKQLIFSRLIQGRKSLFVGRRPVYASGEFKDGSFTVYDYPGYGHAAFFLKFKKNPSSQIIMTAPDGRKTAFALTKKSSSFYCRAAVPSAAGVYSFALPDDRKICEINRKHFEFLNNNIGKEKVILPPFTPIESKNNTVSMIFRSHKLNAFGLWDSVVSKGSELLAGPMYFELVSKGKKTTWKHNAVKTSVHNQGHDAAYTSSAVNSTGIRLGVRGYAEYDGFFKNTYTLENPQKCAIDRLTLCIPLKDELAPLYHVISNSIRSNPAGYLPKGQGELWNGTQLVRQLHFGQPVMHKQFVPMVWLGGVEKGICYFMDSSFGCKLSNTKPQVRILRRGKTLVLEADIINETSTSLKHVFEFGLQATPIKPVQKELLPYTRDGRGWKNGLPNLGDFYQIRGGIPSQWATMPLGNDYSLYKKVIDIIKGKPDSNIRNDVDAYYKKHLAELEVGFNQEYPGRVKQIIKSALDTGSLSDKRRGVSRPIMYTDPRLMHRYEEAAKYFKSEWWNPARISYIAAWRVTLVPSLQDYLVYQHRKLLQLGLRGINLDDAFLMPDDNVETVARVDEFGVLHSDIGILQLRSYIKRLATMMHTEFKLYPRYVEAHMTNALVIPAFAFLDGQLGLEQHYGEKPRTECYGEGEILATYTGRQIGAKPLSLPGLVRQTMPLAQWKKVFPKLTRSNIALTVPFGITSRTSIRTKYEHFDVNTYHKFYQDLAKFGITDKNCKFIPCFENREITVPNKNIHIGYYQKSGEILACVANAGKKVLRISLDKKFKNLINWETGKPMNNSFTLDPGDFRLIYIKK